MSDPLQEELRALRKEIETFNGHKFVKVQNSLPRMLFQAVLRGMAVGLGTVVGASILVSLFLYMLRQIDFVPIIGDWANQIQQEISATSGINSLGENADGAEPEAPASE